jgi:hypothetical protein
MKLHGVLSNLKRLAIQIDGEVLNVAYRPNAITPESKSLLMGLVKRFEGVLAEDENKDDFQRGLISIQMGAEMSNTYLRQIVAFVAEWDLEEDDGQLVPLTPERIGQLPERFIETVVKAIAEDNKPNPTKSKNSRAT